jgi:hypothetical protein
MGPAAGCDENVGAGAREWLRVWPAGVGWGSGEMHARISHRDGGQARLFDTTHAARRPRRRSRANEGGRALHLRLELQRDVVPSRLELMEVCEAGRSLSNAARLPITQSRAIDRARGRRTVALHLRRVRFRQCRRPQRAWRGALRRGENTRRRLTP